MSIKYLATHLKQSIRAEKGFAVNGATIMCGSVGKLAEVKKINGKWIVAVSFETDHSQYGRRNRTYNINHQQFVACVQFVSPP